MDATFEREKMNFRCFYLKSIVFDWAKGEQLEGGKPAGSVHGFLNRFLFSLTEKYYVVFHK